MKKIILILVMTGCLNAKTPIEDLSGQIIVASNIQAGLIMCSGLLAYIAYDQVKAGNNPVFLFYTSAGMGFLGLVLPPIIIKRAVIKFNKSQVKLEVKF